MSKKSAKQKGAVAPRPDVWVEPAQGPGDLACAFAIREVAFIEEQRIAPEVERDAADERAHQMLAYELGHAVGTGRLVSLDAPPAGERGRWGRIGRMAVVGSARGKGIGRKILDALEEEARRQGLDAVVLHAQTWLRAFYEKAGYEMRGEPFEEAGLPHVRMAKWLDAPSVQEASDAAPTAEAAEGDR